MMTISSMSASQAGAYFEKDMNYFDKDGNKGEWLGAGAEKLGLNGEVKNEEFKSILAGAAKNGEQLTKDGVEGQDRAGYNITFSVDKSVSLVGLGDDNIKNAVIEAAKETFNFLEKNWAETRVTTDGVREKESTDNLVGATFVHETSRVTKDGEENKEAPDPQLHVHIFIANMTQDSQGNWKSISNEKLYEYQTLAGQAFQNNLGKKLESLGYSIERIQSGENYAAAIKGISQELKDDFSSRHQDIQESISLKEKELGRSLTGAERQIIVNDTRGTKAESTLDKSEINRQWDEKLSKQGLTRADLVEMTKNQKSDVAIESNLNKAVSNALETVSDKQSVFNQFDVAREALKADFNFKIGDVLDKINEKTTDKIENLSEDKQILKLQDDKTKAIKITSQSVLLAETRVIENSKEMSKDSNAHISKEEFKELTKNDNFFQKQFDQQKFEDKKFSEIGGTEGQKAAAEAIVTMKNDILKIEGVAGAGKTFALEKSADLLATKGVTIVGLAPTGAGADQITQATNGKIEAMTVDKFLISAQKGEITNAKDKVFVVDEAGMTGTKKFDEMQNAIKNAGGKLVVIGDSQQHKSVNQGDVFRSIEQDANVKTVSMNQSVRQQSEITKAVVRDWEGGDVAGALNKLDANGHLEKADIKVDKFGNESLDMNKPIEKLVENVKNDYQNDGLMKTAVITSDNASREMLNEKLRSAAVDSGQVSKEGQKYETLHDKRLDGVAKTSATSYNSGDVVYANKLAGAMKPGSYGQVVKNDVENNKVLISYQNRVGEDREMWANGESMKNFTTYTVKEREFSQNDKIVFNKNAGDLKNSMQGQIKKLEGNRAKIEVEGGRLLDVDLSKYKHIDHGYAISSNKAQGASYKNTHVYSPVDKLVNKNAGYVNITRSVKNLKVYTDKIDKLEKNWNIEAKKENVNDYLKGRIQAKKEGQNAQKAGDKKHHNTANKTAQKAQKTAKDKATKQLKTAQKSTNKTAQKGIKNNDKNQSKKLTKAQKMSAKIKENSEKLNQKTPKPNGGGAAKGSEKIEALKTKGEEATKEIKAAAEVKNENVKNNQKTEQKQEEKTESKELQKTEAKEAEKTEEKQDEKTLEKIKEI